MKRWKKLSAALMASACLFCALLPGAALAEAREASRPEFVLNSDEKQSSVQAQNEELIRQISETYRAAKKRARTKSFKGKCGKYVNNQLVILGINQKYICANGNREYDIYSKKSTSSGGYTIRAYGAKKYSLESALLAIERENPNARNILVGFQRGASKASRKYGHTLFIHGIENGMVYFSDSYAQTVDGVRYKEGEPIVCSIERFCKQYRKYHLDGVIWFT